MTAQEMLNQARIQAEATATTELGELLVERSLLCDIIRHLCDPENVPYPMTSPEL